MTNKTPKSDSFLFLLEGNPNDDFGVNEESLEKFKKRLSPLLQKANNLEKKSWKASAASERLLFQKEIEKNIKEIIGKYGSKLELINAVIRGNLGPDSLVRYQTQFRNRDTEELSENDLINLLGDQKILELMSKLKKEK